MIIDVSKFKSDMGKGTGEWRQAHIIPGYNEAGVKRFAYITGGALPPPSSPRRPNEAYDTKFLETYDEAGAWFAGG